MDGDIELEISSGSQRGEYNVRVTRARAGGEPSAVFRLDIDKLLDWRPELERTILASAVPARRSVPVLEGPVRLAGQELFEALFSGPLHGAYRASLGAAQQAGHQLRLILRLAAPELAALPWEMLFDAETETYLCRKEPLLRRIPASDYNARPLKVVPPLRILGIIASPKGLPLLDTDVEKQHLQNALAAPIASGQVELIWSPEASWDAVHEQLLMGPWHVVHFIGHGDYDVNAGEGLIAMVGAGGRSAMVEASRLTDLLSVAKPVPRLVVLNSCSSGQAGTDDLFSGTAAALVRSGVSAVAAMQFTISDDAAIAFARGLYTAIANGRGIDEAVRNGRIAITGSSSATLEWLTPVLYVRGSGTRLFTLTSPRSTSGVALSAPVLTDSKKPAQHDAEQERSRELFDDARAALSTNQYGLAVSLLDELLSVAPEYPDAATLRALGAHKRELEKTYRNARDAEAAGDWAFAARGYAMVEDDPGYMDAAARRRNCEARRHVSDLQMRLRQRAAAGDWHDVLNISGELSALDNTAANPDGLATRARLELLYQQARRAEDSKDFTSAEHSYTEILKTVPAFRDAGTRRLACREALAGTTATPKPYRHPQIKTPTSAFRAGTELLRVRHDSAINSVVFDYEGTHLGTGGWDRMARVWDAVTGEEQLRVHHDNTVTAVAFSPEGAHLVSCGDDRTARVWDVMTGDELVRVQHSDAVHTVTFSPDGSFFATGCNDGAARIWDAATGALLHRALHDSPVHGVAFHPDGGLLAVVGDHVQIWRIATGKPLLRIRQKLFATGVVFSRNGRSLAVGSQDNNAWIWNASTGKRLLKLRHENAVEAVAFSSDGTHLATGSTDKRARLWQVATGALALQMKHEGWVTSVSFNPDATQLASASRDGTARIWHIAGA